VVQLRALRPDLQVEPLRGNLDTRLRKLDEGQYDAIVLAAAGLKRLGLAPRIRSLFDAAEMIPAAGQGALGIEIRSGQQDLQAALAPLSDPRTWLAVHAERAVSRALGGSCSMPLAAYAAWDANHLVLNAALGHPEDARQPLIKAQARTQVGDDTGAAEALGAQVAEQLRDRGGAALLASL
jgi:hydroxymethylbilane synthase